MKRISPVYLATCISLLLFNNVFAASPTTLQVQVQPLVVNGKTSQVFTVTQPDGTFGYTGVKGQDFDVAVKNMTNVPLVLHWHGIIDPNPQDGVPFVTQLPIQPGKSYRYHYKLKQAGTFWLHSHYQLQEQQLMAAPLIIHDPAAKPEPEAIMFIQDFTFKDPRVVYDDLRKKTMKMPMAMDPNKPDVNDVKFDAYLTNHKTLNNPDVVPVKSSQSLRLRIINASASSNYYVDLGKLQGDLIAIDGADIKPIHGSTFQIGIGNRLDIRVNIPAGEGAYPILAMPEGLHQQTGLILATANAKLPKLSETKNDLTPLLNYNQELQVTAAQSMPAHAIDQTADFKLSGDMQTYRWTINGQAWPDITPTMVKPGQRVAFIFNNQSGMAHPMHFHGHVFQIVEIDGKKVQGREGDSIDVMPHSSVKVIIDTDNAGIWVLHCHVLYHLMGGMMTTVNYAGYPDKFTKEQRALGDLLYTTTAMPY